MATFVIIAQATSHGGLLYLKTNSTNYATLDEQIVAVEHLGAHARHIFPPNELIVDVDVSIEPAWPAPNFVIQKLDRIQVLAMSLDCESQRVLCAFKHITGYSYRQNASIESDSIKLECGYGADNLDSIAFTNTRTSPDQQHNAMYMIGRTAVALIFVESSGDEENWNQFSTRDMFNQSIAGMNWWCEQADDRGVDVSFVYEIHDAVPTDYEPISGRRVPYYIWDPFPGWDFEWVGDALDHLGFSEDWDGLFTYCNLLRSQYRCDWSFLAFLVNAENSADHEFSNGNSAYASPYYDAVWRTPSHPMLCVAYYSGPRNWRAYSLAHEVGHIYDLPDEYSDAPTCDDESCDDEYGYLREPNRNCEKCNQQFESCLMNDHFAHATCPSSLVHLGWRDSDEGGGQDPRDGNTGYWAYISPVELGDRVSIYNAAADYLATIQVTAKNLKSNTQSVVWDGKDFLNQIQPFGVYFAQINSGSQFPFDYNLATPPTNPAITDISLNGETLRFRVVNTFAYAECYIVDNQGHEVARPVWDEMKYHTQLTDIDLRFLPYQQYFTARVHAWRPDGGASPVVEYNFFHPCTWKVGDADGNGFYSVSDVNRIIGYIFQNPPLPPPTPHPVGSGDADCNGAVSISDAVKMVQYLFAGGSAPGSTCSCADYY